MTSVVCICIDSHSTTGVQRLKVRGCSISAIGEASPVSNDAFTLCVVDTSNQKKSFKNSILVVFFVNCSSASARPQISTFTMRTNSGPGQWTQCWAMAAQLLVDISLTRDFQSQKSNAEVENILALPLINLIPSLVSKTWAQCARKGCYPKRGGTCNCARREVVAALFELGLLVEIH